MLHFRYPLPGRSLLDDGLQTTSVYGTHRWGHLALYNEKSRIAGKNYFHRRAIKTLGLSIIQVCKLVASII